MNDQPQKNMRVLYGVVVKAKMAKTVVVAILSFVSVPKYRKYVRRTKRYKAHDPAGRFKEGDKVAIRETRPLSKDKHFEVVYDEK